MASTSWHVMTRYAPRSWLLRDGTILTEPTLEQTSSARKVRVQGSKDSVYYGSLNNMLSKWALEQAKNANTHVLVEITDYETYMNTSIGFNPVTDMKRAKLHHLNDGNQTIAWWRFGLPKTQFYVVVMARITDSHTWSMPNRTLVEFSLYMPLPTTLVDAGDRPYFTSIHDAQFTNIPGYLRWGARGLDAVTDWQKFLRNEPTWTSSLQPMEQMEHPRPAVKKLLKMVRSMEQEQTIQIPDVSDPDNPRWLDLELMDTNVNSEFITDMVEFLDVDASVAQIMEHYEALRTLFRSLGVTVGEKNLDDFAAAVVSGDKERLSMPIEHVVAENGIDRDHTLSVHLPTGTFVVECTHSELRADVLEKWEEAKTIAALGGEEDELLAYARLLAQKSLQARTKSIIAARKGMV